MKKKNTIIHSTSGSNPATADSNNSQTPQTLSLTMNDTTTTLTGNKTKSKKQTWTIVSALDHVLDLAHDSRLCQKFWDDSKDAVTYLCSTLSMTPMQVLVLAVLIERGHPMSYSDLCVYFDCRCLSVMMYADDIEGLLEKRWVRRGSVYEFSSNCDTFLLERGVVESLSHNQVFVPEPLEGLTTQSLVKRIVKRLDKSFDDENNDFRNDECWLTELCKANASLPLCAEALSYPAGSHVLSLLMYAIYNHDKFTDTALQEVHYNEIRQFFKNSTDTDEMCQALTEGTHPIISNGLLEPAFRDGLAEPEFLKLSQHVLDDLLVGYEPSRSGCTTGEVEKSKLLTDYTTITAKTMHYNADDEVQIAQVRQLLSQDRLADVQERLEQQGMRKGIACLFYGSPGTGKTETVLQLARLSGRDIMKVDIASMRSKWVGETEKNIKRVFRRYHYLCGTNEVMPILLFNEADAIFGQRIANAQRSTDKMENAMQNIILEEMEKLEGILIATTNLTTNLDPAFERRFLFKVEFHKPDVDVKSKLWQSMLNGISDDDALRLAARYDFSGGQIENIVRKCKIHQILTGQEATIGEIETFCSNELLSSNADRRQSIGFRA